MNLREYVKSQTDKFENLLEKYESLDSLEKDLIGLEGLDELQQDTTKQARHLLIEITRAKLALQSQAEVYQILREVIASTCIGDFQMVNNLLSKFGEDWVYKLSGAILKQLPPEFTTGVLKQAIEENKA